VNGSGSKSGIQYRSHTRHKVAVQSVGVVQLEELLRRKVGQNEVKSDSPPFVAVFWFK
jgi:hypothetical protein